MVSAEDRADNPLNSQCCRVITFTQRNLVTELAAALEMHTQEHGVSVIMLVSPEHTRAENAETGSTCLVATVHNLYFLDDQTSGAGSLFATAAA